MARGREGAARFLRIAGLSILALGGSMGTDLAFDVAAALPLGVPKVVVSTIAYSHLIPPERITPDLIMVLWAGGLYGLNSLCRSALAQGAGAVVGAVQAAMPPRLDRPLAEISPIERGIMWIGAYEFQHCPDVPWRVVLNECIELAKSFGGTDGHKYVNGVLHQLASQLRPLEVAVPKAGARAPAAKPDAA